MDDRQNMMRKPTWTFGSSKLKINYTSSHNTHVVFFNQKLKEKKINKSNF